MKFFDWKCGGGELKSRIIGASVAVWVANLQGCSTNNCLLYSTGLSFNRTLLMPVQFSHTPLLYVFSLICAKSILFCGLHWA